MGILDLFKKKKINKSLESNKIQQTLSVGGIKLPPEIFELLWFSDGPCKNYVQKGNYRDSFEVNGIKYEISFAGAEEPSAISINKIVKKPKDISKIEKLGYYPSYSDLSPEQRWIYLDWLTNVDKDIDTGYVFIFYYGLERHLFFNKSEKAFKMILRLRQIHRNNSFLSYSFNALTAACIIHNNMEWLKNLLDSVKNEEVGVNNLYILTKRSLGYNMTAKEIIKIASQVGFTNKRYINNEPIIFEQQVKSVIEDKYLNSELPLGAFKVDNVTKEYAFISSNYSLSQEQRCIEIPSIIRNKDFSDEILYILQEAHNRTKIILKKLRSTGCNSTVQNVAVPINNDVKYEPDIMYNQSVLFATIDVHQFDENVEYYNKAICPNCKTLLNKRPVSKMKCKSCNNDILVKNSIFTGQKLMMTIDEYNTMKLIKDEKTYRRFIYDKLSAIDIKPEEFKRKIKKSNKSIEDLLIEVYYQRAKQEYSNFNMGLYRNDIMNIGQIYERIKDYDMALNMYLLVCYYDLRGCTNDRRKYDQSDAFLAPAVIKWINKIKNILSIDSDELKQKYTDIISNMAYEDSDKSVTNNTWKKLAEELYES